MFWLSTWDISAYWIEIQFRQQLRILFLKVGIRTYLEKDFFKNILHIVKYCRQTMNGFACEYMYSK